jgi:hypothetical protein
MTPIYWRRPKRKLCVLDVEEPFAVLAFKTLPSVGRLAFSVRLLRTFRWFLRLEHTFRNKERISVSTTMHR